MEQLFLTTYGPVPTSFFHWVTSYPCTFFHLNQKTCIYEMGLWVWNCKQWTKCKAKAPLTSVMREQALQVQFAPFSVKSSILQLAMALNSLGGQWKFDRLWLYIFTRAQPISTRRISSKYTAEWKLECFVELFLLKLISSGKACNSQALWHSWLQR